MNGTSLQLDVRPRRQGAQAPHEIWKGTLTSCPGASVPTRVADVEDFRDALVPERERRRRTASRPVMIIASRSQVATAMGRTSAAASELSAGSGASRHSSAFGAV